MSNKGNHHTRETKNKISLAKTKLQGKELQTAIDKGLAYIEQLKNDDKQLPTLQGLALAMGINYTYLIELYASKPELTELMDHIKLLQEQFLLTRGVSSKSNPVFSMFLLKAKHNYQDKPQNLTQNNFVNISPDVLKDALKLMNEENPPKK
jgi:hypothetical protein